MDETSTPFLVLTVTLVMIILAVGTFAFYVTVSQTEQIVGSGVTKTETFTVDNPSEDQTFSMSFRPDSTTITIQQYTGFGWIPVDSTYISVDGRDITIEAEGMLG